jgi:hypothetical protein
MDILGYIVTDPRNHFRKLCPFPQLGQLGQGLSLHLPCTLRTYQKNEDITAPTNKLA